MTLVGIEHAVNTAVYARLNGSATLLAAATGGVHDNPPQPMMYPYAQLGESIATKDATFEADGRNIVCTLHVWSQYAGTKEAATIMGIIGDLLDEYTLSVSGCTVESCEIESSRIMRDPDGITRHGILELRVRVATT